MDDGNFDNDDDGNFHSDECHFNSDDGHFNSDGHNSLFHCYVFCICHKQLAKVWITNWEGVHWCGDLVI